MTSLVTRIGLKLAPLFVLLWILTTGQGARALTSTGDRLTGPLGWPSTIFSRGPEMPWDLELSSLPWTHGTQDQLDPSALFPSTLVTASLGTFGSDPACPALLLAEGVGFELLGFHEEIATPVRLHGQIIGGVTYGYYYQGPAPWVFDCRLALALVRAAPVLRSSGITEVIFASHYRPSYGALPPGRVHRHAQGLAMDIKAFRVGEGHLVDVARDYETGLGFMVPDSCIGRPLTPRGLFLRKLACDLDEADIFESILTPDYDEDHWNHFHFSVMHPQNRAGLRPRGTALLEVPLTDLPPWAQARSPRHEPELRRWDVVATRPWPSELNILRHSFGIPENPTPAEDAAGLLRSASPPEDLFARLASALGRLPGALWQLLHESPRTL